MKKLTILTNGIIKENPVFRLVLGTCPVLAVTTLAINGLGMGIAAMFVLICSNVVVSLLRNIIPGKVRLPAYITIIATFVTILEMLMKAYVPSLAESLGVFLPLIVVNCIILGRAEMFASKNKPIDAALDGIGMGLGFTLALVMMGSVREFFGAGSIFGVQIYGEGTVFGAGTFFEAISPMSIFILPAGGFFVFGVLMALVIWLENKAGKPVQRKTGCDNCPVNGACGLKDEAAKIESVTAAPQNENAQVQSKTTPPQSEVAVPQGEVSAAQSEIAPPQNETTPQQNDVAQEQSETIAPENEATLPQSEVATSSQGEATLPQGEVATSSQGEATLPQSEVATSSQGEATTPPQGEATPPQSENGKEDKSI